MIGIYKNFLSDDSLQKLNDTIKNVLHHSDENVPNVTVSTMVWDSYLQKNSAPIIRYVLNRNDDVVFQSLKKEIESKIPYFIHSIIIHFAPKLSYIPWHNDSHVNAALTIYLNEKWNPNWGGYFLYKIDDEIKAIKPEFNLAVLQQGGETGLPHCVTTTNIDADMRISLQMFLTTRKKLM
jgi:Rps23 Pro-64 3,4-dihydroxylase Tpa1-like proline 4-hydroxylase